MRRPIWCAAFLVALEQRGGNVALCADLVDVSRQQVYRRRRSDARFRADTDAVFARLEAELVNTVSRSRAS